MALIALVALATAGCEREREKYLEDFKSGPRAEIRAGALEKLGDLENEEDFPLFLKGSKDESPKVRRAAAYALGKSGDARAVDTLGELLADGDEDVQAAAAKGLSSFGNDKARAYLLNAYARQGASARIAIASALGPRGVADAIRSEARILWDRNVKALEAGGQAERVAAAEELGRSGRGEAVERLMPLLGDDSVLLAAGAARGLGASGDRRAVSSLVAVLKVNYPALNDAACEALGRLGDPAAVEPLTRLALDGGPRAISAVKALGELARSADAGRPAAQALCSLATQAGPEVASLSARFAGPAAGCPIEPILARLSRGGEQTLAALQALQALGGTAGADKVAALLDSQDSEIRLAAALALAELEGTPAAAEKAAALLKAGLAAATAARQKWVSPEALASLKAPGEDEHEGEEEDEFAAREREKAEKLGSLLSKVDALNQARAEALGVKLVDRDAGRPVDLVDDLPPGTVETLGALARAAARMGAKDARDMLAALAADADPAFRAAACEALPALGTPEAIAAAAKCLEDESLQVMHAASLGLARVGERGVTALEGGLARRSSERPGIIRALGQVKAAGAAPKVAALLREGGLEAVEAAVALERMGDKSQAGALAAELNDPATPARLEIIEALGALGDPSGGEALSKQLLSERPEVRAAAARAIGRAGLKDAAGVLEALRSDYYAEVRRAADEALARGARAGQGAR